MARSNAQRGAYYKARTRKYLVARGWQIADLEVVRYVGGGIPVKRDQFGADLLAVSHKRLLFVQVKGGKTALKAITKARREFDLFKFPPFAERWIVCWLPRARQPHVVNAGVQ